MSFFHPEPPPYDALVWAKLPFPERAKLACQAWALQGYGTPLAIYLLYALKVAAYVGAWVFFCSFSPSLGGFSSIERWWLEPVAFQKAIAWSMLFEVLGLGCGSGPLTGRYVPPIGGFLYFLRPGTTKLSCLPRWPLLGGARRTWFDVLVYAALLGSLVSQLVAPTPSARGFLLVAGIAAVAGLADRTLFLAMRGEHYWTTTVCFAFAPFWLPAAKAVQLALWFWAGVSKLNHHFPTVVGVMTSNSPLVRFGWIRRLLYRRFPDDLRPSTLAVAMGHAGTALELAVPIVLATSTGGLSLLVGMALMLALHGYITSNVPMGVPIEWNVMVVYGGFALFYAHPEVSVLDVAPLPIAGFLLAMLVALPLLGNLFPRAISFLLAMRYYAGNWAYGVWLFRGESWRKLEKLTKTSPWVYDQLARMYDERTRVGLVGKVFAFRLMHLHGRALSILLPKAVPRFEDVLYMDGEIIGGLVLGWNFGDGHLHREPLLRLVQEQCGFEEGELRCIFVESQPLFGKTMGYRIVDAKSGLLEEGELAVAAMRARQPWEGAPS